MATEKRKRSGKAREEAKKAAIAAAEAAEAAAAGEVPATTEEVDANAEVEAETPTAPEAAVDDAEAPLPEGEDAPEPSKKRKRTGKMREEAKRIAIAKRLEAEAEAAARGEVPEEKEAFDFEQLAKRIPQALKKLHPVFKQAKKAESMRLIKKIRFLKTKENTSEVAELETQLKFLSAINLNAVATTHLRQKLKKHHSLKHVEFPEPITELLPVVSSVEASSSTAPDLISKVENRLCSSKQVADAIKPVLAWTLSEPGATLNLAPAKKQPKAVNARTRAAQLDTDDEGSIGDGEESDGEEPIGLVTSLDSDDEVVMEDKAADEAGWESGDMGEGGGDDAGWESGSVSGEVGEYNIASASSGSESDAPPAKKAKAQTLKAAAAAPPPKAAKPEKAEKPAKAAKAAVIPKADGSSSMFLPSLAAGFAAGDSDSDPDMDYDPTGTIGTNKPERKNRRGQRARQAIWEKKYGKNAKHVVKARDEAARGPNGERRDGGWGARGAAKPAAGAAPAAAPAATAAAAAPAAPSGGFGFRSQPPRAAPAPAAAAAVPTGPEHPSWAAAKARKAKEMAIKDAPKATKIVFD